MSKIKGYTNFPRLTKQQKDNRRKQIQSYLGPPTPTLNVDFVRSAIQKVMDKIEKQILGESPNAGEQGQSGSGTV